MHNIYTIFIDTMNATDYFANFADDVFDLPIPKQDTAEDIEFSNRNNAITFFEMKTLERLFEAYRPYQPNPTNCVRRSYHSGRIYGNGQYGDPERERDFQAFIRNADLVQQTYNAQVPKRQITEFDMLQ